MNSKLPSSSYSVLQESSSDAALSMSALGKPGWTHSSLTSLEAAAKASKTQLGTFRACSFILLTSSNYLHFHINFFPPCLFYVPFPTTQLPALAPWQWKREKKMQPLDRLQPSRTPATSWGAHALPLFTDTQQQEVTAVVSGASPASASCKYREKKQ